MKLIYYPILFIVLLASCSIQSQTAQPGLTQIAGPVITLTPLPTITPYSTPFSTLTQNQVAELNLESVLIQPGDLPEGYTGGQVSDTHPIYLDVRATPVNQIYQEFDNNNVNAGGVTVIVLNDNSWMGNTLFSIGFDLGFSELVDINGETMYLTEDLLSSATFSGNSKAEISGMDGYFKRCNTIVYIRMTGTVDRDSITSYAEKLDKRLTPLICR